MSFKRIQQSILPDNTDGFPGDVRVSTPGYIYRKNADNVWWCSGLMQQAGGRLFDVQGEPLWNSGQNGDVAVTLSGLWWRKESEEWMYCGKLGTAAEEALNLEANNLRVNGNFSPAIRLGRVPIYDTHGDQFGYLKIYPKKS